MQPEEAEVEMLATSLTGSTEEGRKRLIGLLLAEERGFVMGVPIPSLVVFRFLRQWGEFAMHRSARHQQQQSVLVPYTINSLKALAQSFFMDDNELAFLLSNVCVLLHLLRTHVTLLRPTTPKQKTNTKTKPKKPTMVPNKRPSLLLNLEALRKDAPTTNSGNGGKNDKRPLKASEIEIAPLDWSGNNYFLVLREQEEADETARIALEMNRSAQTSTTPTATGTVTSENSGAMHRDGNKFIGAQSMEASLSPVEWLDHELCKLLRGIYTQLLFNIREQLVPAVERTILENRMVPSPRVQSGSSYSGTLL